MALLNQKGVSAFFASACTVKCAKDVKRGYRKLRQENSSVDHIKVSYSITHNGEEYMAHEDDGEHGGSYKLRAVIGKAELNNIIIFVTRQYGGEHLGSKRFEIIKQCAEAVIEPFKLLPE